MQPFWKNNVVSTTIDDACQHPILALNLYGNSVQDTSTGGEPAGKNLLNISADLPLTAAGVTISRDSEGNIILNGTATSSYTFTLGEFNLPYNTYTLSINSKIQGVGIDCKNFAVLYLASTIRAVTVESSGNNGFYCNVSSGITFDNFILNPQIEIGSTATTYEPYIGKPTPTAPIPIESIGDDGNFKVTTCGKNLYENIIHVGYQSTINGITFTVNKDGTITANGTSTDSTLFFLKCTEVMDRFVGKDVIFNGCPKGGGTWDTYYMQTYLSDYTGGLYDRGDGVLITNWEADRTIIRIYIGPNATVNNLIFKPMIRLADITDDTYEPYMGSTAEITTGLPLCSVGDYRDELIYNADGTGKIIKRVKKSLQLLSNYAWSMSANPTRFGFPAGTTDAYVSNGYATAISRYFVDCRVYKSWIDIVTDDFESLDEFKAFLDANEVYVLYPIAEPQVIELSAAEIAALSKLNTLIGHTKIFNSGNAVMDVKYLGGYNKQAQTIGFWNS